jgi:hypothetical protein
LTADGSKQNIDDDITKKWDANKCFYKKIWSNESNTESYIGIKKYWKSLFENHSFPVVHHFVSVLKVR